MCGSEVESGATDHESVEEILEELSALLHEEGVEAYDEASDGETTGVPKGVPVEKGGVIRRVRRKVVYKKVRKRPP